MRIYSTEQIKSLDISLHRPYMMRAIADEFIRFSNDGSVVPMPLHLSFPETNGECHVKAGYNTDDAFFVIKVATGFYGNVAVGLPSGDGLLLLCCKNTGTIQAILCDSGYLTTLRTAITACIAAELTPWLVDQITIVGTGALARLIVMLMHQQNPNAYMTLWGRNKTAVEKMQQEYSFLKTHDDLPFLVRKGGVVITTTASHNPLIMTKDIHEKIHLIALGADQPNKQEIESDIFSMADQVIVDSQAQAQHFGDSATAIRAQKISGSQLHELGYVLQCGVAEEAQIMITDSTGIAPQDIGIAKYLVEKMT